MHRALISALVGLLTVTTVHGQAYQWKDSQGRTIISDTPPPSSARQSRAVQDNRPSAGPSGESGKSLAERDMEFKKRQQDAATKAEKDSKEKARSAEQAENCQRAQRQQAALESGQRMATTDANGERRFLEDDERQREIERARRIVADTCK